MKLKQLNSLNDDAGFSLLEILVAVGILGFVSLGVMKLFENIYQGQNQAHLIQNKHELMSEINMILQNEKHCKISLIGLKFKKVDIDESREGLPVELFLSNQTGSARYKKFSAIDSSVSQFDKLTLKSLKLIMNTGTGFNYTQSPLHDDVGEIRLVVEKKVSQSTKVENLLKFPIHVKLSTDVNGESTIISCSKTIEPDIEEQACVLANKFYDITKNPRCQNSKGGYNQLSKVGGNGGFDPISLRCPEGMAITGLILRAGSGVDAVGVNCREINYNTLSPIGFDYRTSLIGGPGGTLYSVSCTGGRFAMGIFGRSGERVDRIGLNCREILTNGPITPTLSYGGLTGTAFTWNCNPNTFLRELIVNQNARVDGIVGSCW